MGEKHSKNKSKGITLIALIITVIIMLILVAVTIDIAVDGKLFDKAQDAVNKTNDKVGQTQNRVDELMGYLNGTPRGNNTTEETPTECTHEYGEWTVIKAATYTEAGERSRTCTKCGSVQTEGINKLECSEHVYQNGVCPTCGTTVSLQIGATIDYKEYISSEGTAFTTMPSYTAEAEKTGHSEDQVFTVTNNSGIEWIVLGEENGQIKITTKNVVQPSSGGYTIGDYKLLRLSGQAGYTNFVDELHEIGAIYGKGKYADTSKFTVATGGQTGGRSFIMEDLGYDTLTRTAAYTYAMHDDGKVYRHEVGEEIDLTTPGTTGGDYSTFKYMTMDASNTTEEIEEGKQWNELKTEENGGPTSVTIYNYTYSGSETLSTTVSKADYYYWLANRYISCGDYVGFYHINVDSAGAWNFADDSMFNSWGREKALLSGCRPVVFLCSGVLLTYDSSSNSYTIK